MSVQNPQWRLILTGSMAGAWNMAIDEALLDSVADGCSGPVLRMYRWACPTVTLGYSQRGDQVVNLEACQDLGVDVVRRITGGRAVLHEHEVTYAVVSPERSPVFPGGILGNYRVIAGALRKALQGCGLPVDFSDGHRRARSRVSAEKTACFTASSRYELMCQGLKVAGCAQRRRGSAFLQHGSIPVDIDCTRLFKLLDTEGRVPAEKGGRLLERSVGWVNRWTGHPLSISQLEAKLVESFSWVFGIQLESSGLTKQEQRQAKYLYDRQYSDSGWSGFQSADLG